MFEHSVKVPRIYKTAAKFLMEVKEKRASLKQLVYQRKHPNIKGIYALIAETLKHFSKIDTLIEKSELLVKEKRFDPWLARILITELLWNRKQLQSESKPIKTILSYYDVLEKHKESLDSNAEQKSGKKVQKPRFVRVNTLAITIEEAVNGFREEGWTLIPSSSRSYDEYLSKIACLEPSQFMVDLHIKELLLFPSKTPFYKHNAYRQGMIILQDKASCLPTHLLNPPPGTTVLDMCAAPGMKTTHLAALLNNEGTVYAVERDEQRFNTLNKIVQNAGATCVKTINKDVLEVTADDCPNVEYILVDPTCSGSGITDRVEVDDEPLEVNPERLKKLSDFQIVILKHALTRFPQAKRIVYSTCSIYPEENENVVSAVEDVSNFKLISAESLLEGPWKGCESKHCNAVMNKCLYTKPEKDLTNGFFIAVFERDKSQGPSKFDGIEKHNSDLTVVDNKTKKKQRNKAKNVAMYRDKDKATKVEEEVQLDGGSLGEAEETFDSIYLKKKHKKRNAVDEERITVKDEQNSVIADSGKPYNAENNVDDSLVPKKKNKKKKKKGEMQMDPENITENNENIIHTEISDKIIVASEKRKKHKKRKHDAEKDEPSVSDENIKDVYKARKKKKIEAEVENFSSGENTKVCEKQECKVKIKKNKKHKTKDVA